MILKKLASIALLSTLAFSNVNAAEVDKATLLESIRGMTSQYSEFKALLTSPDQSVRFAAFDAMYNSGDATLRELALDEALAYPDATMQALALKYALLNLNTIVFQLSAPEGADEKTLKWITELGGQVYYTLDEKNVSTGAITKCKQSDRCSGQISGFQLSIRDQTGLSQHRNSLQASFQQDGTLSGTLSYTGIQPIVVSSTIK